MNAKETIQDRLEKLKGLNQGRFDYVLARSDSSDVAEALDKCGRSKSWFYKFSEEERTQLEALAYELHCAKSVQAQMVMVDAIRDAAQVVVDMLSAKNDWVKLAAAKEILDRGLGKAQDNINIKGDLKVMIWDLETP